MKRTLLISLLALLATIGYAQNKVHIDLDYNYNLGLSMHTKYQTFGRSDCKMGGHALHFAVRYDALKRLSVGAGLGLDHYTNPDYNATPIYATLRYKPFQHTLKPYVFADLGYGIGNKNGFTGRTGLGYNIMFRKHFGMNFQFGYNLTAVRDSYIVWTENNTYEDKGTTLHHSLTFGVGLSF